MKNKKKLVLKSESLRHLNQAQLAAVAAGDMQMSAAGGSCFACDYSVRICP